MSDNEQKSVQVKLDNGSIVLLTAKQVFWILRWAIGYNVLSKMPKIENEMACIPIKYPQSATPGGLTDVFGYDRKPYSIDERRQTILALVAKDDRVWHIGDLAKVIKVNYSTISTDLEWLKEQPRVIIDRKFTHRSAGKGNPICIHYAGDPKPVERISKTSETMMLDETTKIATKFSMMK